jgi:hypothetical protein
MIGTPCNKCSGNGKVQSSENVDVKIPKGVDDGTRIRLAFKGEAGDRGGSNGDLYLFISIEPHNIFKRSEENLYYELPISFTDAALGATVEVPSIDGGKTKIKIPSGTQSGKQLRLRGKGMPILRRNVFGDLYIRVITEVPMSLTKRQKELLTEFKTLEDTKSNPLIRKFFVFSKNFLINGFDLVSSKVLNSVSNSFCLLVRDIGTSVITLIYKSPNTFLLKMGMPFPLSLNCFPLWVPDGILIFVFPPSIEGTSTVAPRAASAKEIGNS